MGDQLSRNWLRTYYPTFDGLRALAILSVFFCHFGWIASPVVSPWLFWAGVDLFFVLSGFLITGILFDSRHSPRFFRNFYIRRALRILPLYWGFFLAIALLTVPFGLHYSRGIWISVFFLQNLILRGVQLGRIFNPTVIASRHGILAIGTLWSLCVEEQFYALWPWVVRLLQDRNRLLRTCLWGAACVLVIRCTIYILDPAARSNPYLYCEPYSRFDSLLIGAALNLWLRKRQLTRAGLRRLSSATFLISCMLIALALLTIGRHQPVREFNAAMETVGYTLMAVAAAAVLLRSLDEESRFARLLRLRPLQHLGRISYGFYFFHSFFADFALHTVVPHLPGASRLLILPLFFGITYAVAYVSFRFWESPFLRLKQRLAPADHPSIPRGTEESAALSTV